MLFRSGPQPPFVFTDANAGNMRIFDPHLKLPYALEWDVALEKALSSNQTFTMTYLGSVGRRLLRDDLVANPNPLTRDRVATFYLTRNSAYSNYNALQVQFQRRLSHGLQALLSYSWQHSLDINSSNVTYENPDLPSTLYSIRQDYGNSDFDIRQGFSAALTYNVPGVKTSNGIVNAALRNWSTDVVSTDRTGTPFNVVYTPADPGSYTDGAGNAFQFRPNQVPGQPVWIADSSAPTGKRLNQAAFAIPSTLVQGSESRNNIGGYPLVQIDLAARRQFNFGEGINLQFRVEGFNVLNHPNFSNPENSLGTCALGVPCTPEYGWGTSQAMLNQGLGGGNFHGSPLNGLYQVGGPRSLQASMKLQF